MTFTENDEYSVIVPDYLIDEADTFRDLELEEETINRIAENEDETNTGTDYSDKLDTIIEQEQIQCELLEDIYNNQTELINSQYSIYNCLHFACNLAFWIVIVIVVLIFGKYIKSILI